MDGEAVAGGDLTGVEGEDVVFVLVDSEGGVDVGARGEGVDESRLLGDGVDRPDLAGVVAGDQKVSVGSRGQAFQPGILGGARLPDDVRRRGGFWSGQGEGQRRQA